MKPADVATFFSDTLIRGMMFGVEYPNTALEIISAYKKQNRERYEQDKEVISNLREHIEDD